MADLIPTLLQASPQLGGATVFVIILGLLLKREAQANERHADELKRTNAAHAAETADLREQITGLREQVDEVNKKLDEERRARRAAEDGSGAPPRPSRHRRRAAGGEADPWPTG